MRKLNCDLCKNVMHPCNVESKNGFLCTRQIFHKGNHVACGTCKDSHPIEEWENENTKETDQDK